MNREKSNQPAPEAKQRVGHITAPIEEDDLERIKDLLTCHSVTLHKCNTPDNWWTLLLPLATTKRPLQTEGQVPTSVVRLPDGFSFLLEEGILTRDKTYDPPPRIIIEVEQAQ